ncbi:MAG: PDGLE domain-containing protein [Bacillota bacterium]|nr:PDGLE domain-containing protein [Bacillota bacterium]
MTGSSRSTKPLRIRDLWVWLLLALAVAAFLSPLASSNPDGLERVAEDHGFAARAQAYLRAFFPDYTVPGISHPGLTTALAGIAGTLLTFGAGYGAAILVSRGKREAAGPGNN